MSERATLFEFADARLLAIVGGYEIGYMDGKFFAREHDPRTASNWWGTAEKAPWRFIEEGEIAIDLTRGVRIVKPLRLGEVTW